MEPVYRFEFGKATPRGRIDRIFDRAFKRAQRKFRAARVRLDGKMYRHPAEKVYVVSGTTEVGQFIAEIFTDLVTKAFGERAFRVDRVEREKILWPVLVNITPIRKGENDG